MSLQIVPSIDLRNGQVVRLKQGDYARQVNYALDPVETARAFAAAGAKWLHVVDLDGAKEGRPVQTVLIARIVSSTGLQAEVGGGIRATEHIETLLNAGAKRAVVGTAAMENWQWFEALARDPKFAQRLVLALDAKEGMVATRGWTETSTRRATDVAAQVKGWALAGILYTDVSKDGMLQGPNIAHTRKLAEATDVPVIASGGVGNIEHVRQLCQHSPPIWGAIIGRSLYEGALDLREAIAVARGA